MARPTAFFAIACAGFAVAAVQAVVGSAESAGGVCESAEHCPQSQDSEDSALLQHSSLRAATVHEGRVCSTRSLIIGRQVGLDSYLQYNAALRAVGADFAEFLNVTRTPSGDEVRFETDVDFVQRGRPLFGIVYISANDGIGDPSILLRADALKLKEYIDAGGLLVVGDQRASRTSQLMIDLGSSIRQVPFSPGFLPCSTPQNAPYAPVKHAVPAACPLTKGVTGLQGNDLEEVIDLEDRSHPLFTMASNTSFVVARVEKTRNLVVVGDDEPFDDDCVSSDQNNRLAFGPTTNLRFFKNLFKDRCNDDR